MKHLITLIIGLLLLSTAGWAQHKQSATLQHNAEFRHFRVAMLLGHTFVPARHSPEHVTIPSWALDVEYWFNHQFGLGFHNDLELQTFVIEENGNELLEREYPMVFTFDMLGRLGKSLVLLAGPGIEVETNENLFLFRVGLEYEIEFFQNWDISPTFFYDRRLDAYDTWSFAFGVGRRF